MPLPEIVAQLRDPAVRAAILDESESTRMIQLAGTGQEVDAFVAEVERIARVLELVRSGVAAMQRGHAALEVPV